MFQADFRLTTAKSPQPAAEKEQEQVAVGTPPVAKEDFQERCLSEECTQHQQLMTM